MSLSEIVENVKQARELALLGNYESSLTYYSVGLAQLKKFTVSISEANRKQQWQTVSFVVYRCLSNILYIVKASDIPVTKTETGDAGFGLVAYCSAASTVKPSFHQVVSVSVP